MAKGKANDHETTTSAAPGLPAAAAADPSKDVRSWTIERLKQNRKEYQEKMDEGSRHRTDKIRQMDDAIQGYRDALGEIDAELVRRGVSA